MKGGPPDGQPELVQAEPGVWRKLIGLFGRGSDAVIVNRRAPQAEPQAAPQPPPAPWPEPEPANTAVPLSPPEPATAPPPPETKPQVGDDFLIGAWRSNQSAGYDAPPGGAIGGLYMLADSRVGDWIYKTFLKPKPRRR